MGTSGSELYSSGHGGGNTLEMLNQLGGGVSAVFILVVQKILWEPTWLLLTSAVFSLSLPGMVIVANHFHREENMQMMKSLQFLPQRKRSGVCAVSFAIYVFFSFLSVVHQNELFSSWKKKKLSFSLLFLLSVKGINISLVTQIRNLRETSFYPTCHSILPQLSWFYSNISGTFALLATHTWLPWFWSSSSISPSSTPKAFKCSFNTSRIMLFFWLPNLFF